MKNALLFLFGLSLAVIASFVYGHRQSTQNVVRPLTIERKVAEFRAELEDDDFLTDLVIEYKDWFNGWKRS